MAHQWQEEEPELPRPRWIRFFRKFGLDLIRDHTFVIAAAVAYFGFIALFPTLIALVSLVGLFANPALLEQEVAQFTQVMPGGASELVMGQLHDIVRQNPDTLSLSLLLSLLVSLWGASSGGAGLIKALNIAYEQPERRSFLQTRGVALALALGSIGFFLVAVSLMVGLPYLARRLEVLAFLNPFLAWLRWVVVAVLLVFGLSLVYRYAPCRPLPKWRWITWGSCVATAIWLGASGLFSLYVRHAGGYQETYGALGGVIVLLFWLYLSALAVLVGAELDSTVAWAARGYRPPEEVDELRGAAA